MLTPLKRKSLAESVYEQLRDHILHGKLQPGDELPAERLLCEQLGVNRSAVREGLKRLEQAGLVAIQQGEPTRILDFKQSGSLSILGTLIVRSNGTINTDVVRSVLDLRTTMAAEVSKQCAQRANEATLDELAQLVNAMARANEDLTALQKLAMRYWGVIVSGSDNIAYQLAYNALDITYRSIEEQLTHVLEAELRCTSDYRQLHAELSRRESEAAAVTAQKIVGRGQQAILTLLNALDEQPGYSS